MNYKALLIGAALVILSSLFAVIPVYGWVIGALLAILGLLLSLRIQQTQLVKTFTLTHTTDSLLVKDHVDVTLVKREEAEKKDDEEISRCVLDRLSRYPNLFALFKDHIPPSPRPDARLYKDDYVEKMWGPRFTLWGMLLNDTDQYYSRLLSELDSLVAKHKSSFGEERLRAKTPGDPSSFLSELMACDAFESSGVVPVIEPLAGAGTQRLMDLSVVLEDRPILVEVMMPHPSEDMLRQRAYAVTLASNLASFTYAKTSWPTFASPQRSHVF